MQQDIDIDAFFDFKSSDNKEILEVLEQDEDLRKKVKSEAKSFLDSLSIETKIENSPYFQEYFAIKDIDKRINECKWDIESIKKSIYSTPTGKENNIDFSFYEKKFSLINSRNNSDSLCNISNYPNLARTYIKNLKNDLLSSLEERWQKWVVSYSDAKRAEYVKLLYQKIAIANDLKRILDVNKNDIGKLWSLSGYGVEDSEFVLLKEYARKLENDKSLENLAMRLGRSESESENFDHSNLTSKSDVYLIKNAYKGQLKGLRLTDSLSSAIPSELSLLSNKKTKIYFFKKYAEKKLLSFAYRQRSKKQDTIDQEKRASVNEERKGPVIICIDTSASMQGGAEEVAKTLLYAIVKLCMKENRRCFLISFSIEVRMQDLSIFARIDALNTLANFLRKSFNGGTDVEAAFRSALGVLKKNNLEKADVLIISDFISADLTQNAKDIINEQKQKGTRFFSLTIGNLQNSELLNNFDENWNYNLSPNAKDAIITTSINI